MNETSMCNMMFDDHIKHINKVKEYFTLITLSNELGELFDLTGALLTLLQLQLRVQHNSTR